jgi:hypothetical protein
VRAEDIRVVVIILLYLLFAHSISSPSLGCALLGKGVPVYFEGWAGGGRWLESGK